jgi:hypothetical protein
MAHDALTNGMRCDIRTQSGELAERINGYAASSTVDQYFMKLWMCSLPEAPLDRVLQQSGPPTILRHRFQSA